MFDASAPDLLRLVAVPVFAVAAWRDVRTRRVPNTFWYPLAGLGVALLVWEWTTAETAFRQTRILRTALLSTGIVVPLAYGFWRLGAFGGADAKALMALAVLFPSYPTFYLTNDTLPLIVTTVGVFSLTILTNAVLFGAIAPIGLAAWNLLEGRLDKRMLVARPMGWKAVEKTHGTLLSAPAGGTNGLDLDALRMYLRWRDLDLATVRANPRLRDPATLPEDPNDPTDGAIDPDGQQATTTHSDPASEVAVKTAPEDQFRVDGTTRDGSADPWGAVAFLEAIDHDAYGTAPAELRDGLDVLVSRDEVWVSPGLPFLVAVFAGLVSALLVGDILIGLFVAGGVV